MDTLLIPKGTLCYINELEGEVWMAQGVPQRRWLHDMELDAWAATIDVYPVGRRTRRATRTSLKSSGAPASTSANDASNVAGSR